MIVEAIAFVASRRLSDSNDIGIQEVSTPSALLWTMDNQTSFKVSNHEKATAHESRLSRQAGMEEAITSRRFCSKSRIHSAYSRLSPHLLLDVARQYRFPLGIIYYQPRSLPNLGLRHGAIYSTTLELGSPKTCRLRAIISGSS